MWSDYKDSDLRKILTVCHDALSNIESLVSRQELGNPEEVDELQEHLKEISAELRMRGVLVENSALARDVTQSFGYNDFLGNTIFILHWIVDMRTECSTPVCSWYMAEKELTGLIVHFLSPSGFIYMKRAKWGL